MFLRNYYLSTSSAYMKVYVSERSPCVCVRVRVCVRERERERERESEKEKEKTTWLARRLYFVQCGCTAQCVGVCEIICSIFFNSNWVGVLVIDGKLILTNSSISSHFGSKRVSSSEAL